MGLKANLGRLETRLNCIIYYTERHTDQDERERKKCIRKKENCMRGYQPMTVREIGERRNRAESWCCVAKTEQLWILKGKAYEI